MSTGSEDLDRARSAVVFLSSDCSGVLVAPRVVLTAAHCVLGLDALPSVQVRHGAEVWESAVVRCATHPSAVDGGTERCDVGARDTHREHDLAVLHLASEVPSALTQPLPILIAPPVVASDAWWRGRHVRLVGWQRRPALVGDARRYSGDNVVTAVHGAVLVTVPREGSGFSTRIGASGGPALLELDGREQVIGVLFGGERSDSRDSVYAATFHPDNASWIVRAAPEAFEADELDPERPRFSRAQPPRSHE